MRYKSNPLSGIAMLLEDSRFAYPVDAVFASASEMEVLKAMLALAESAEPIPTPTAVVPQHAADLWSE